MKTLTMKCVSCNGSLDISDDMSRFNCGYCGTEQVVDRRGGTVSLRPIVDAITRVQVSTDRTAAELALTRLYKEWQAAEDRIIFVRGSADAETQGDFYLCLWSLGMVVGSLMFWNDRTIGWLAPIVLVASLGPLAYVWYLYKKKASWKPTIEEAEAAKRDIERNIAKNKEIVDS